MSWIIIGIVVLLILWVFATYNGLVTKRNRVDNSWGQIEVQTKRRYDLIPNLVETVKGYAAHERAVLTEVTQARANATGVKLTPEVLNDPEAMKRFQAAQNQLTGALSRLLVTVERYPDLKANQNFLQLQDELTHTENKVSFSRQFYNDAVLEYNNAIESFPGNLFAGIYGRRRKDMLAIPEVERAVPRVDLSMPKPKV